MKNKKKWLILALLLFVIIGVTGYEAYSYFYTSGDFSGSSDVSIAGFDPQVNGDFLGDGGTLTLTCPESETGSGTVNCSGELVVTNNGSTDITVSTSEPLVNLSEISSDSVTANAGTPTFSWDNSTIGPGSTGTLTVTVPVSLSSYFADGTDHYRSSAYEGEAIGVTVSFKITATQTH